MFYMQFHTKMIINMYAQESYWIDNFQELSIHWNRYAFLLGNVDKVSFSTHCTKLEFDTTKLILQIPAACAQIAMSQTNWEILTSGSRGWGMSLTYRINRIGDRMQSWGTPWMGVIGSLSWSWIEIIFFSYRDSK